MGCDRWPGSFRKEAGGDEGNGVCNLSKGRGLLPVLSEDSSWCCPVGVVVLLHGSLVSFFVESLACDCAHAQKREKGNLAMVLVAHFLTCLLLRQQRLNVAQSAQYVTM